MLSFVRGNALYFEADVRDGTDTDYPLVTPSAITLTLIKPDGTNQVTAQAMTLVTTGVYALTLQSLSNWQLGTYAAVVAVTRNTFTNQHVEYFQLTAT